MENRKLQITSDIVDQLQLQIEALLKEQNLISKRAASLQRRNIKLVELNNMKDEFIAIASHQLRTPATAVKQYINLLLGGYVDPLTEDQRVFLQKAEESNNRQLTIIDDLLQVARLDSDSFKLNISKIELRDFLQKIIDDYKEKLEQKHQSIFYLRPRRKMYIFGDEERLRMIFENIIENASNYSANDSTIEVRIHHNKETISVEIKDHGVGIDRQDQSKLFQKFSRIPNPLSVEVGGTGLGLYWASKVAKLHSGSIKVKSKLEEGSTFTVCLPVAKNSSK